MTLLTIALPERVEGGLKSGTVSFLVFFVSESKTFIFRGVVL